MRQATRGLGLLALVFSFAVAESAGTDALKIRTWTSRDGRDLKAALVAVEGQNALMRREDGRTVSVGLALFSDADQEILRAWIIKEQGTGALMEPRPGQLPAFADGKHKGKHTFYEGLYYDLTIGNRTVEGQTDRSRLNILLQPKMDGTQVGEAIRVSVGCNYHDEAARRSYGRHLTDIQSSTKPAITSQPSRIKLEGKLDDGAAMDLELDIGERSFSITASVRDPEGIAHPTKVGVTAEVAATHTPSQLAGEAWEQAKKEMAGWSFSLKAPEEKAKTQTYLDSQWTKKVERIDMKGPWGKHAVSIVLDPGKPSKKDEENYGVFSVYSGMPAHKGFKVRAGGSASKAPARMIIAFQ